MLSTNQSVKVVIERDRLTCSYSKSAGRTCSLYESVEEISI